MSLVFSVSVHCVSRISLEKEEKCLYVFPQYLVPSALLIEYGNLDGRIDENQLFNQLSEFNAIVNNLLAKRKNSGEKKYFCY